MFVFATKTHWKKFIGTFILMSMTLMVCLRRLSPGSALYLILLRIRGNTIFTSLTHVHPPQIGAFALLLFLRVFFATENVLVRFVDQPDVHHTPSARNQTRPSTWFEPSRVLTTKRPLLSRFRLMIRCVLLPYFKYVMVHLHLRLAQVYGVVKDSNRFLITIAPLVYCTAFTHVVSRSKCYLLHSARFQSLPWFKKIRFVMTMWKINNNNNNELIK